MRVPFFLLVLSFMLKATFAETYTDDWKDASRDRTVPVRIYLPDENRFPGPCPVVLLSHGLGGSREGFPYLGDDWSRHGYVVIAMQHPGSDREVVKRKPGKTVAESMKEAITAKNSRDRVDDVKFVLDELERRAESDAKLKNRLDLKRIGIGGHSFGAHTTLNSIGRAPFPPEPRLKAAIAMSPSIPAGANPDGLFGKVKVPVLHLTGTKDSSPIQPELKPIDRRIPFDNIDGVEQYLVIFQDGNHMLFSGHERPFGLSRMEKECQPIIQQITLKFLDATLRDDAGAEAWLQGSDFQEALGEKGTVEKKGEHRKP